MDPIAFELFKNAIRGGGVKLSHEYTQEKS
jgi:hypothetical protein